MAAEGDGDVGVDAYLAAGVNTELSETDARRLARNAVITFITVYSAAFTRLCELMPNPLSESSPRRRMIDAWKALAWQHRGVTMFTNKVCNLCADIEGALVELGPLEALLAQAQTPIPAPPSTACGSTPGDGRHRHTQLLSAVASEMDAALSDIAATDGPGKILSDVRQLTADTIEIIGILVSAWSRSTRHTAARKVAPASLLAAFIDKHDDCQRLECLSSADAGIAQVFSDLGFDFERNRMTPEARRLCAEMDERVGLGKFTPRSAMQSVQQQNLVLHERNRALRQRLSGTVEGVLPPPAPVTVPAHGSAKRSATATATATTTAAARNKARDDGAGGRDTPAPQRPTTQYAVGTNLRVPAGRPAGAPTDCGDDLKLCEEAPRFDSMYTIHSGLSLFTLIASLARLSHMVAMGTGVRKHVPASVTAWQEATMWDVHTWVYATQRKWPTTPLLCSGQHLEVALAVCKRLHVLSTGLLSREATADKENRRLLLCLFGVVEHVDVSNPAGHGEYVVSSAAVQGLGAVVVDTLRDVIGVHALLSALPWLDIKFASRCADHQIAEEARHVAVAIDVTAREIRPDELDVYAARRISHSVLRPGAMETFSQRQSDQFTEVFKPLPYPYTLCSRVISHVSKEDADFVDALVAATPTSNLLAARAAIPDLAVPRGAVAIRQCLDHATRARWRIDPLTTPCTAAMATLASIDAILAAASRAGGAGGVPTVGISPDDKTGLAPTSVIAMARNPAFATTLGMFIFFSNMNTKTGVACGSCVIGQQELLGHLLAHSGPFILDSDRPRSLAPPVLVTIGGPLVAVVYRSRIRLVTACTALAVWAWCRLLLDGQRGVVRVRGTPRDVSAYLHMVLQTPVAIPKPLHWSKPRAVTGPGVVSGPVSASASASVSVAERWMQLLKQRIDAKGHSGITILTGAAQHATESALQNLAFRDKQRSRRGAFSAMYALATGGQKAGGPRPGTHPTERSRTVSAAAAATAAADAGSSTEHVNHITRVVSSSRYMEFNGVIPDAHTASIACIEQHKLRLPRRPATTMNVSKPLPLSPEELQHIHVRQSIPVTCAGEGDEYGYGDGGGDGGGDDDHPHNPRRREHLPGNPRKRYRCQFTEHGRPVRPDHRQGRGVPVGVALLKDASVPRPVGRTHASM